MDTEEFVGVPIHQDVSTYEEKIYGGVTLRQIVCFAIAIGLGLLVGVFCTNVLGMALEDAAYPIMIVTIPPGAVAFVHPDDLPLEVYARLCLTEFANPQRLCYKNESDPLCRSFQGKSRNPLLGE